MAISPQLTKDAQYAASQTGINPNVVLTQFVQENGYTPPSTNNFGNISYFGGPGQKGYFTSSGGTKIATYATPQAGLNAYDTLMNTQYAQVAKAGSPAAELTALQNSPYDAAHYPSIFNTYKSVTGQTAKPTSSTSSAKSTGVTTGLFASKSALDWTLIVIAVVLIAAVFF